MGEHSLFLIRSDHPAWQSLRVALSEWPEVRLLGEARTVERARLEIPRLIPDLIISAGVVNGKPVPPLLGVLRGACPGTRVLLLLDVTELELLAGLRAARIEAGVLWRDITPTRFRHLLTVVLEDGFVVGSLALAEPYYAAAVQSIAPMPARSDPPRLSAADHRVLVRLCAGESHRQIASGERISRRTVDRAVGRLCSTLSAASPAQLGAHAAQLGLLPPTAEMAQARHE